MKFGDQNINFFYVLLKVRRNMRRINKIRGIYGVYINIDKQIVVVFVGFFKRDVGDRNKENNVRRLEDF